jgi:hypothetical protein
MKANVKQIYELSDQSETVEMSTYVKSGSKEFITLFSSKGQCCTFSNEGKLLAKFTHKGSKFLIGVETTAEFSLVYGAEGLI